MRKKISLHSLGSKAIFPGQPWCSARFPLYEHQMRLKHNQKLFWKCHKTEFFPSLYSQETCPHCRFSGCDLTPINPNHGSLPATPLPCCFLQDWQHIYRIKTTPSHLYHFSVRASNKRAQHSLEQMKCLGRKEISPGHMFPRLISGWQNIPKTLTAGI